MKKSSLIIFTILMAVGSLLFAQEPVLAATYGYLDADPYIYANDSTPYVTDVSGDGKDDLVMVSLTGTMVIYLNGNIPTDYTDTSTATNFNVKYTNLGTQPNGSLITADLTGDNKKDIIVGTQNIYVIPSTSLASYENQTNQVVNLSTTPSSYLLKISKLGFNALSMYGELIWAKDVNGNGTNDLVISDEGYSIYYIADSLFSSAAMGTTLDLAVPSNYSVLINAGYSYHERGNGISVGDVTNDGKADIALLLGVGNTSMNFILGSQLAAISGTGNSLDATNIATIGREITTGGYPLGFHEDYSVIEFADVTGDGKSDLLLGTALGGNGGNLFVFKNELLQTWEGSLGVSESVATSSVYSYLITGVGNSGYFGTHQGVYVDDINGNGKNDLLIRDGGFTTGCTNCGAVHVILDSQLDMFATALSPSNTFPLTTSANYAVRIIGANAQSLGGTRDNGGTIGIGDVNTDGKKDVVIGEGSAFLFLSSKFEALGTTTGNIWPVTETSNFDRKFNDIWCGNSLCRQQVGDITGDGANDTILGGEDIFIFRGGVKILNLDTAYSVVLDTNASVDLESVPQVGIKNVRVKKGDIPVAIAETSFASIDGLNWSSFFGDVSVDAGKSVVSGFAGTVGVQSHNLLVPKRNGALGVQICPDAVTLADVADGCTGSTILLEGESGLSVVSIEANDYWNIEGVSGTGAMNVFDTTAPGIRITNIGLLENIPDKTPLFYYFTSQTPRIQGITDAFATIHVKFGDNDNTVVADMYGKYAITISELPRQYVSLTYYAVDLAGNQSNPRVLNLMIGIENFPHEQDQDTSTAVTTQPNQQSTDSESILPPEPEEKPQVHEFLIVDQNGKFIPNISVFINDQKYIANAKGLVYLEKELPSDAIVYVELDGIKQIGVINGGNIVINQTQASAKTIGQGVWWWIFIFIITATAGIIYFKNKISSRNLKLHR